MPTTPIFDLEQALPKARFPWVRYFIGLPIGVLVMVAPLISQVVWDDGPGFNGWLLLPGLYVAIFIHELGHVVAAWLGGMPTGAFSVGGFVFLRSGEGWTYRFDGRLMGGGFMAPLATTRDFSHSRFAWLTAGGPIASILFAIACWYAFDRLGDGAGQWIGSMFWTSVILLPATLIPYKSVGLRTDMARLWQHLRDAEESQRWMAVVALQTEDMKGVRPRNWNAELMEQAMETPSTEGHYYYVQLLASLRSADMGDEEGSVEPLEKALEFTARSGNRRAMKIVFQWAACLSATVRKNAAQARLWMERAQKAGGKRLDDGEGIEADIAMLQGRYADALRHLEKRREALRKRRMDSGIARFAKERIAQREEQCRVALAEIAAASAAPLAQASLARAQPSGGL